MPEIKCEYGHAMRVSTDEWIKHLTLDQLRYARQQMHEKISTAEQQPKRTVWGVYDGIVVDTWYREEDYEKAADHLLRIFKAAFIGEAKHFKGGPNSVIDFKRAVPTIYPQRVTQIEYDTEYFPLNPA